MTMKGNRSFWTPDSKAKRFWASRVGTVFNTMPRDGSAEKTVWLTRKEAESEFSGVLHLQGKHICLDGPTGTGKTSLALTGLHKENMRYTLVQVTEKMTWSGFCKELVDPQRDAESSISAELDGGLEKGLPTAKFRVTLGSKWKASDRMKHVEEVASSWTEQDVCRSLSAEKTALFIDDFERANDDIVVRVSDMCKLLTQKYHAEGVKLIIVGTDDICRRLFSANPSLESRLHQISLGTLPDRGDSWRFLQMGFDALRLTHPGNNKYVTRDERVECVDAIYRAADGLPKSLNELGSELALRSYPRERINPAEIREVADEMPIRNLKLFRRESRGIVNCIKENPTAEAVLLHLYKDGIGQIHDWEDIQKSLSGRFSHDQIEHALCELVELKFLTLTGRYSDVLFVSQPTLAHTLGVVWSEPDRYDLPPELRVNRDQLVFPFKRREAVDEASEA